MAQQQPPDDPARRAERERGRGQRPAGADEQPRPEATFDDTPLDRDPLRDAPEQPKDESRLG